MKIALVRGPYLNRAEMQNYEPLVKMLQLTGISSLYPIDESYTFATTKFFCPVDLPSELFGSRRVKLAFFNRFFGDALVLFGLEKYLLKNFQDGEPFDIVHSAETYFYFTQQCLAAKRDGLVKKVVVTVWENLAFNNEGIRKRKAFKRRALDQADHFIAVTLAAKKSLIAEGCEDKKISVVRMGVDLTKFNVPFDSAQGKQNSTFKVNNEKINILFVGRLEEEKGIWELLDAFRQLPTNCQLHMVGSGGQQEKLRDKIGKLSLEDRVTIGQKTYDEMPLVYQKADIFVLPSKLSKHWQEQYGMVLIEAMASGLPIITTKSGAIVEIVGDAAILVEPGDGRALFMRLSRLVKDAGLRRTLGVKARLRAEKYFDSRKIADTILRVYENLLS